MKRLLRWVKTVLGRVFLKPGRHCCHCEKFKLNEGVCGVYLIYKGRARALRVSPWNRCFFEDMRESIQVMDWDQIKEQIKK